MRTIRQAAVSDIPSILEVMDAARRIMREGGNPNQWKEGYCPGSCIYGQEERGAPDLIRDEAREMKTADPLTDKQVTPAKFRRGHLCKVL